MFPLLKFLKLAKKVGFLLFFFFSLKSQDTKYPHEIIMTIIMAMVRGEKGK